jgi:hypothetical protein
MQCVEAVTDILCPDIFLISYAVPISNNPIALVLLVCFLLHVGAIEVPVCLDMRIVSTGHPTHPANWTPA